MSYRILLFERIFLRNFFPHRMLSEPDTKGMMLEGCQALRLLNSKRCNARLKRAKSLFSWMSFKEI